MTPFHNGKTAIRAGWGIFDSLMLLENEYDTPLFRSFPFFAQAVLTGPCRIDTLHDCNPKSIASRLATQLYGSLSQWRLFDRRKYARDASDCLCRSSPTTVLHHAMET